MTPGAGLDLDLPTALTQTLDQNKSVIDPETLALGNVLALPVFSSSSFPQKKGRKQT